MTNKGEKEANLLSVDFPTEQLIFQLAMDATPNAMIIVDTSGQIVLVNSHTEKLFGYTKQELIGQRIEILLPERFRRHHAGVRSDFFQEKNARSMGAGSDDLVGLRKDGSEVPLEIGLNPLRTPRQHLVLASIIDITERKKRTELKLIQVQKMESLGVLAGGIAHDFNNLLTSILGYADLALRELSPVSPAREFVNQVIVGAHSASDLVKQLLAYSGKGWFIMQPLQISDVVEEMAHLLQVSISKKCVLNYRFEPDLPCIDADSSQLRQVIMNLIVNASDAVGTRSGVIAISTGMMYCDHAYLAETSSDGTLSEGPYVYFEVSDTGCGMDDETAARIFDPFFSTKTMGRGLGLAAVQGIVRGHGGHMKLYSEVGKGTTFKVLFPPSENSVVEKSSIEEEAALWRGEGLVLIIDDEETIRTIARIMLEKMGFSVITAEDGLVGVQRFKENSEKIVFVLLDMTMPHMNGEKTFRELRKICSEVQVILSSGYSEQTMLSQFVGKGLAGFIQKPYRYDDLQQAVKKFIISHSESPAH